MGNRPGTGQGTIIGFDSIASSQLKNDGWTWKRSEVGMRVVDPLSSFERGPTAFASATRSNRLPASPTLAVGKDEEGGEGGGEGHQG